ncbi:lytic transglycosylase domain-containing protein [Parafrigoribacterium soli]|uniref:lytic transglycosylase domain-containing protein n=1 Tax=Parafrigoribacterium soli TaxID=3144663 RepID=UPI0032EF4BAB
MVKPATIIVTAVAVAVAVVLVIVAVVTFLSPDAVPFPASSPRATVATLAPLPEANAADPGPGVTNAADPAWITRTAAETSIPVTALKAYAGVTLQVAAANPKCALSWNTLAGIGWVESRHGLIHGTAVDANGTLSPPLYGVALDGNGFANVPDSDGGAIDGDVAGDRAVGPMQFLPDSWRNWHVDANGDGVEDPQNLFDATMAAAHYLCRAAGTLGTHDGWERGILAYNSSHQYLNDVMDAANRYATEAAG